jgi:hypothetical protein
MIALQKTKVLDRIGFEKGSQGWRDFEKSKKTRREKQGRRNACDCDPGHAEEIVPPVKDVDFTNPQGRLL